jgi:hypothetical protein
MADGEALMSRAMAGILGMNEDEVIAMMSVLVERFHARPMNAVYDTMATICVFCLEVNRS